MESMFEEAWNFKGGGLSDWDTSNVINFRRMFYGARRFNNDISHWNVSRGQNFNEMFRYAERFNRQLCWNINPALVSGPESDYQYMDRMLCGTSFALLHPTCSVAAAAAADTITSTQDGSSSSGADDGVSSTSAPDTTNDTSVVANADAKMETELERMSDYAFEECFPDYDKEYFLNNNNNQNRNASNGCLEDDNDDPSNDVARTRAGVGSFVGFLYFIVMYILSCCQGLGRDIGNAVLIALSAISFGMAFAYAGRNQSIEERCTDLAEGSAAAKGTIVVDTFIGLVVLLICVIEFCFDCLFCLNTDGGKYPQTRLLGAHSKELQLCQWWTVVGLALCVGTLGGIAIVADSIGADYPMWAIVLFAVYEGFAVLAVFGLSFYSVNGIFGEWSATKVWTTVVWLIVDIPGIVAVLTGIDGSVAPLIAQLVVEAILICASGVVEGDD